MRLSVVAVVVCSVMSLDVAAFQTNDKYKQVSDKLVADANTALNSADKETAQTLFERALVADPANVAALLGLGRSHEAQDRIGKGLKYYRHALEVEPNNLTAIEVQSYAFLKQDLVDEAGDNLEKLKMLCRGGCETLDRVDEAITHYRMAERQETASASGK